MSAQELFLKDGKSAGVFYCLDCKIVHRTVELAEQCCKPYRCQACGGECPRYWTMCDPCRRKRDEQKEAERFQAAEKLTEWDGWVYSEGYGREGFCESIADMEDYLDEGQEMPEYVWTCDPVQFASVDVDWILEHIAEDGDAYEDFDSSTLDGIEALKAAVEAFNKANEHVVSYQPNYKRALLTPRKSTETNQ